MYELVGGVQSPPHCNKDVDRTDELFSDHSQNLPNALIATLKKLQMGYISGAR